MKKLLFFLFLFIILYVEPLSFAGVKFSHIWKIGFIFITIAVILRTKVKIPRFVSVYLFYAISLIISPFLLDYPFENLVQSSKYLFFPFLFIYLLISKDKGFLTKQTLSIFIILSFLPFYFNLLPQLGLSYELEEMGFEINDSISGIFQQPHEASLSLSLSIITLLFILYKSTNKRTNFFLIVIIALGCFFLLKTYVRIGLLLVILSFYLIFIHNTSNIVKLKFVSAIIVLVSVLGLYISNNNSVELETYKTRFLGQTGYSNGGEVNVNKISSGRLKIWESTLSNWVEDDSPSIIMLGLSEKELIRRNKEKTGMAVFSHNEFVNAIAVGGIIIYWWKNVKYVKNNFVDLMAYKYALTIFISIFIFSMLQGGPISFITGLFVFFSLKPTSKSKLSIKKE